MTRQMPQLSKMPMRLGLVRGGDGGGGEGGGGEGVGAGGDGEGGGGEGFGGGGGDGVITREPQSVQSVPSAQRAHSEPGPPSSQVPSAAADG